MNPSDFLPFIDISPDKRFGKPCIKGTRITVAEVLEMLAIGMSHAEILEEHPNLTETNIRASLAYASYSLDKGAAA